MLEVRKARKTKKEQNLQEIVELEKEKKNQLRLEFFKKQNEQEKKHKQIISEKEKQLRSSSQQKTSRIVEINKMIDQQSEKRNQEGQELLLNIMTKTERAISKKIHNLRARSAKMKERDIKVAEVRINGQVLRHKERFEKEVFNILLEDKFEKIYKEM